MDAQTQPEVAGQQGVVKPHTAKRILEKVSDQVPDPERFKALLNTTGSLSNRPLYVENHVDLLIDGPATYSEMLRAIAAAERYIHVETYIFANDKVGQQFADLLIEKAEQGVSVRLIFDSIGSLSSGDEFFDRVRGAGVEIYEFNDVNPLDGGNPLHVNVRDHRKILIVDGEVAFTGGVNFSKTYSSRPGQQSKRNFLTDGWRDTHVAIYGPAVAALEQVFYENWRKSGGSVEDLPAPEERSEQAGDELVFVLDSVGGNEIESPIYHSYLQAIDLAQERVWITQAYFVPDKDLMKSLLGAKKRGVDVRIILPGLSDSGLVLNASRSHYGKLLKRGIRIFETTSSMMHAKTAVADGVWSTVGSSNLDPRSKLHNFEVNVIVVGADFAQQLELQFLADIQDSREVSFEMWQARPLRSRFAEFFSRALSYWL